MMMRASHSSALLRTSRISKVVLYHRLPTLAHRIQSSSQRLSKRLANSASNLSLFCGQEPMLQNSWSDYVETSQSMCEKLQSNCKVLNATAQSLCLYWPHSYQSRSSSDVPVVLQRSGVLWRLNQTQLEIHNVFVEVKSFLCSFWT